MRKIFTILLIGICSLEAYSQSITISPDAEAYSYCPIPMIVNILSIKDPSGNATYCYSITWEVNGGVFENGQSLLTDNYTQHTITWDGTATENTLKITVNSCEASSVNGTTTEWDFNIKSVENVSLTPYLMEYGDNPTIIDANNRSIVTYRIDLVSLGKAPGEINNNWSTVYDWKVPSGWTISGSPSYNPSPTDGQRPYAQMTVMPDNCTGGNVTVQTNVCDTYSNVLSFPSVTRPVPPPNKLTGPSVEYCGDKSTKTYSTAAPYISTYQWSIPTGWTGSGNSSSIIVTPNGANGGTITVASLACGRLSGSLSESISLTLSPSTLISGPAFVCDKSNFIVNNLPSNTSSVSWLSSNGLALTIDPTTGAATKVGNGYSTISAVVNGGCGPLSPPALTVYAGKPGNVGSLNKNINNPTFCVGETIVASINTVPGTTNYTWTSGNESILEVSGSGTSVGLLADAAGTSTFSVVASNICSSICGTSSKNYFASISNCGGGGSGGPVGPPSGGGGGGVGVMYSTLSAYPNPTSSTLTIEVADGLSNDEPHHLHVLDRPYQLFIMDRFSRNVFFIQSQEKLLEIPVDNLPPDIYYLNLIYKDAKVQKQILIKR